ncbi:hypothetical protein CLU79DRAFT_711357, partial [Phycomyces nitens]
NRRSISYEIPLKTQLSNPPEIRVAPTMSNKNKVKVIFLEADIDDLESRIRNHETAIHCLQAEVCLKEG